MSPDHLQPAGPLRLVILGPTIDGTDVGESYWAFRWTEALSRRPDVALTVLSSARPGRAPLATQLPHAEVVTWPEPAFLSRRLERFNALAGPAVPLLFAQAGRWLRAARRSGRRFDIAHQILPQAMRYPSPLRHSGLPYVIGPLGGGLTTPEGFRSEVQDGGATRLRALDRFRLANDPWLRRGYAAADLVLGVAPYVADAFRAANLPLRRFETVLEQACEGPLPDCERSPEPGRLRLLHVGRAIRTKGLRDVIRALALLPDCPGITLTSAGDGPDLPACRAEVAELGLASRVTFLGRIPRPEVDALYRSHDIFAFPSFREPMGGVFFEAMSFGLPVIAAARGGPDAIVDETCALKIPVGTPDRFARDIADAIRRLARDPDLRALLGAGARARISALGSWDDRAGHLLHLYRSVIATPR